MPLGVDDGSAAAVRVSQVGGHRKPRHLLASDLLELDIPHKASQFNFVDLFHILWFFGPMQRWRIGTPSPKKCGKQSP
jgi:hypothetical protein